MKLAQHKPKSTPALSPQEILRRKRTAAATLRSAYPAVEQIRIDLDFGDDTPRAPAPQSFVLNPPAQAFFRFPCPRGDCDGHFDLEPTVADLIAQSQSRTANQLDCHGTRIQDRASGQKCLLHVRYAVGVNYRAGKATP